MIHEGQGWYLTLPSQHGRAAEFPNTFPGTEPSKPPLTPGCGHSSSQSSLLSRAGNGPERWAFGRRWENLGVRETGLGDKEWPQILAVPTWEVLACALGLCSEVSTSMKRADDA